MKNSVSPGAFLCTGGNFTSCMCWYNSVANIANPKHNAILHFLQLVGEFQCIWETITSEFYDTVTNFCQTFVIWTEIPLLTENSHLNIFPYRQLIQVNIKDYINSLFHCPNTKCKAVKPLFPLLVCIYWFYCSTSSQSCNSKTETTEEVKIICNIYHIFLILWLNI